MAITLGEITLPAGLLWRDEHDWFGVARVHEPSVTGVPVIQTTPLVSGRPVTFVSQDAWLTREQLHALIALVAEEGPHTLTLHDGRTGPVMFLDPPMRTQMVVDYEAPEPTDFYQLLELRLIAVDAIALPEPDPEE